ncbi:MAG: hypothetical protein FWF75_08675 [Propionibacteriaceae bacterium]|nr:hypothetical protein [Propionibacteriaceae bacterium]
MKIAIAGCEHDTFDQEREIAAREGIDLEYAYRHTFTPEEMPEKCLDADAILSERGFFGRRTMERLPHLVAVGRYGPGLSGLDVPAACERNIALFHVPDLATEAVSDHAIALAVALLRDIVSQDRHVHLGDADVVASRPLHLFSELTFGVLGCGRTGTATARKAQALGFSVVVSDAHMRSAMYEGFPAVDAEDLLASSDIVSLHLPRGGSTYHLIGRTTLPLLKPNAIVVNTGDGDTVDLGPLCTALQEGALRGAALDTTDQDPATMAVASSFPGRLIITPRMAWYTEETYDACKRRAIQNLIDYLLGRPVHNMINPQILTGESTWPVARLHIEPNPRPAMTDPTTGHPDPPIQATRQQ